MTLKLTLLGIMFQYLAVICRYQLKYDLDLHIVVGIVISIHYSCIQTHFEVVNQLHVDVDTAEQRFWILCVFSSITRDCRLPRP